LEDGYRRREDARGCLDLDDGRVVLRHPDELRRRPNSLVGGGEQRNKEGEQQDDGDDHVNGEDDFDDDGLALDVVEKELSIEVPVDAVDGLGRRRTVGVRLGEESFEGNAECKHNNKENGEEGRDVAHHACEDGNERSKGWVNREDVEQTNVETYAGETYKNLRVVMHDYGW